MILSLYFIVISTVLYFAYSAQDLQYSLHLLDFNHINLILAVDLDTLAKILIIFILTIGSIIYSYANRYLESDNTRRRFLWQLNFVLLTVILLAISANLLTAFIAWQLIGIGLYLLLNHYHYDPRANRAAKKKFVINRLGDCSFLLAIILAYQSNSAESFSSIITSPYAVYICALLYISIMIKCAQFPFHIWLIDTMETPTPVSALMHAGVINSGGILLCRISSTFVHNQSLCYLLLFSGLISAILSIHWMNKQPDIKKKLAYSTMGQMGYMLMQCSLGAFPAAIFHLISHGFYKASLFLNAGESLNHAHRVNTDCLNKPGFTVILLSFVISLLMLCLSILLFHEQMGRIPLLIYGFMIFTLISMVTKVLQTRSLSINMRVFLCAFIALLLNIYLYLLLLFCQLLSQYEFYNIISVFMQITILLSLLIAQCFIKNIRGFKDKTEDILRFILLNPLRMLGNAINSKHGRLYLFAGSILLCGLSYYYTNNIIIMALIAAVIALIIANRCLSIKLLLLFIFIFECAFITIAMIDGSHSLIKIGLFHCINISLVMLALLKLSHKNQDKKRVSYVKSNRLPTRVFYLAFNLLLLIGIPGTASFISELYLLNALVSINIFLSIIYMLTIILLAIVIMHSLQLYAFSKNYTALLLKPINKIEHVIFASIILINIFCGLYPSLLLSWL